MREIKFRAWFELEKKMVESKNLGFQYEGDEDERFTFAFDKTDIDENGNEKGTLCFVPIQYTDIKDKEDREIYDGDIVLREITVFGTSVNEDFIGEVKYYECRWWIDNGNDAIPLWNEADELTILGNIYENRELLEEK